MSVADPVGPRWMTVVDSRAAFEAWAERCHDSRALRRAHDAQLENSMRASHGIYRGYCRVCKRLSHFSYAREPTGRTINWRESLVCDGSPSGIVRRIFGRHVAGCRLNCRQRLSLDVLEQLMDGLPDASIYIAEQLSATAKALRARYARFTSSEFLNEDCKGGAIDPRGVRHEDLTSLSFSDNSFDALLALDVLEHIADYKGALSELHRVLRPGGKLIATAPFAIESNQHVVRATIDKGGAIQHLLPPEYHGDPLNSNGVLCFYYFGWDFLDDLRAAGFTEAKVYLAWSSEYAYLGPEHSIFVGIA